MRGRKWDSKEDKFLEKNYGKYTVEELARKIERTEISINQRIVYLKNRGRIDKKNHNTLYSEEENRYLSENYGKITQEEMAMQLRRTPAAIKQQIKRLKKIRRITEKISLKKILKNMMITRRDVMKERILGFEKLMIAEKLGITLEDAEKRILALKEQYEEEKEKADRNHRQ